MGQKARCDGIASLTLSRNLLVAGKVEETDFWDFQRDPLQ